MTRLLLCGSLAFIVGCPTTDPGTITKDTNTGNTTPTGDTSVEVETGINPVAVGFELVAQLNADGTLGPWSNGTNFYIPTMIVTFADEVFFQTGANDGHFCVALASFGSDAAYGGIQPMTKPDQVTTTDGLTMYWSYDATLDLDTDPGSTDCDELLDPTLWGENGEILLDAFDGAHIGLGFGAMTPYLAKAWEFDSPGTATLDFLALAQPGMFAQYIAINDADGNFVADDWTTGIIWGTDDNGVPLMDKEGNYTTVMAVDTLEPGADMPSGQLQSYAFWYQDFPLLDLSNLKDGAPN